VRISVSNRHPALRWAVPAGVLCLATAAAVAVIGVSGTSRGLPTTTPSALISAMDRQADGYSGTLVAQMSLDLPVSADADGGEAPILLMAGAHTMRYWYGGSDEQRVALLGTDSESDVFYSDGTLWQWNSATNVATRSTLLPAGDSALGAPVFPAPLTFAAITPEQLASRTLAAVDAGTAVTVVAGPRVAGHATYQLTLRPGSAANTRIASVRIDVDAARKVPLGVQVFARGQQRPSIDVSFSSITYKTPAADYLRFTPPPGASVRRGVQQQLTTSAASAVPLDAAATELTAPDTGWSAVTSFQLASGRPEKGTALRSAMRAVSGSWGHGYLLESPLLCMLVTADGRVLSGSVDPAQLYAAASG
jgi:hypothetical protein